MSQHHDHFGENMSINYIANRGALFGKIRPLLDYVRTYNYKKLNESLVELIQSNINVEFYSAHVDDTRFVIYEGLRVTGLKVTYSKKQPLKVTLETAFSPKPQYPELDGYALGTFNGHDLYFMDKIQSNKGKYYYDIFVSHCEEVFTYNVPKPTSVYHIEALKRLTCINNRYSQL